MKSMNVANILPIESDVIAQSALDSIHKLAHRLRDTVTVNSAVSGATGAKNRLALQTLKQIELLSEILFKSAGRDAPKILETLEELIEEAQVLFATNESPKIIPDEDESDWSPSNEKFSNIVAFYGPSSMLTKTNLKAVVDHVKQTERMWRFQYQLWLEKHEVAKCLGCDIDQLTLV